MRTLRSQTHWVLALICGFGMVAIAVSTAEKTTATLPPPVAARDMHDLSTAFRNVAQTALPGVVTIRTTSRVSGRRSGSEAMPEGFEEFFKGDPRFREFFRGMPQQPQERRQDDAGEEHQRRDDRDRTSDRREVAAVDLAYLDHGPAHVHGCSSSGRVVVEMPVVVGSSSCLRLTISSRIH